MTGSTVAPPQVPVRVRYDAGGAAAHDGRQRPTPVAWSTSAAWSTPAPWPTRAIDGQSVRLLIADVLLPLAGDGETRHRAESLAEHYARLGPRPAGDLHPLTVLDDVGLTGHGGGHVPVAAKWRRTLADSGPLTVVANGAESEPWSAKDASLLRQRPHLVLDGLLLAAEALGADRAVVWLHDGDGSGQVATHRAVADALRERAAGAGPAIELLVGPVHYLTGESSAAAQAVAGGAALPTARRPRVGHGPRTLVHNVETLARVALAARRLPATATTLLTVVGPAGRLVTEVARGSALFDPVRAAGWTGPAVPDGALLGGYAGTWVPWEDVVRARVDPADPVGRLLGAGIVAPLPHGACPVEATAVLAEYLAGMSAGQCGPCVFGLPAIAESVRRLADGRPGRAEGPRLAEDLDAVAGRGACHHPDGVVGLVRSLRTTFPDHVAAHERGRTCDARWWA